MPKTKQSRQNINLLIMASYRCPHCNSSGSSQKTCKKCNTNYCTSCKKTLNGDVIKSLNPTNKCPSCGTLNKIYYVDYNNGKKC